MLREADGSVRLEHDRHIHGLFRRQEWLDALAAAGFAQVRGVLADHSELEPGRRFECAAHIALGVLRVLALTLAISAVLTGDWIHGAEPTVAVGEWSQLVSWTL